MIKKALFFTAADPEIGLGHLFRCDALAYAMAQQHIGTELIVASRSGEHFVKSKPLYTPFRLADWTDNPCFIQAALNSCDIPVFDAYDVSNEAWEAVRGTRRKVVVFDDYGEKPFLKGFLINGSPGTDYERYGEDEERVLLLGPGYQVLRPPFCVKSKRKVKKQVESVGIMLGGTDHLRLLPVVLDIVVNVLPSSVKIYVVGKLANIPVYENVQTTGFLNTQELKKLFDSLDILISAAGQSVAEAVSTNLPTLMIQTAENQKYNYDGWKKKNAAVQGGTVMDISADSIGQLESGLQSLLDYQTREELRVASADLQLHFSTTNLCKELLNQFGAGHATDNPISVP